MDKEPASAWDLDLGILINMVKQFPYLYNSRHENFKNTALRERTWCNIAERLKVPVGDCQRIWKNLRDKWSKEKRITMQNPGISSEWEFYEVLKFLQPFVRRRRRARLKPSRTNLQNAPMKGEIEETFEESINPDDIVKKMWNRNLGVQVCPENVTFLESEMEEAGESEEITLDFVDDPPPKEETVIRYQTSEEAFGAYVACRLMDFSVEERQTKRIKIFKILEDLE
ncbi:uncharacterized protein [Diabrotica undecimpunctata]|uniref:uncharacterized protein n=1 Tax=Diabrotica undecimpunctata TaxID=50387 RepID=UPI003B640A18